MLKHLKYTVEFTSPSRTISASHSFNTGLTTITGPNGKGKSLNLEMIEYALFGTEALRGASEDYKQLSVELDFELKGIDYTIRRTKNSAKLVRWTEGKESNVDLASGTKPVNQKMQELFGYSSSVFRVANLCNQGKIEELGNMRPAQRKQLVDETIGLNILDQLVAFIDEERKRLSGGVKALESFLVAPVEPVKPEGLLDSVTHKSFRDSLAQLVSERNMLQLTANQTVVEPEKVELHSMDAQLQALEQKQERRIELQTKLKTLAEQYASLPATPRSMVTALEPDDSKLEDYQRWLQNRKDQITKREMLRQQIGQVLTSEWTVEELDRQETLIFAYHDWETKKKLKEKNVPHDCPSCGHHWEDEDPRLQEYAAVPDAEPERPRLTQNQISQHRRVLERIQEQQPLIKEFDELDAGLLETSGPAEGVEKIIYRIQATRKLYYESQAARVAEVQKDSLMAQMQELSNELETIPDQKQIISAIIESRKAVSIYNERHNAFLVAQQRVDEAKEKLKAYSEDLQSQLAVAEQKYIQAVTYETQKEGFDKAKVEYDKAAADVQAMKDELDAWNQGREAVATLRVRVKGYLLPSLNSVASTLIDQMTGGELPWIAVNDQFEITVAGQKLETLSGAGKAVANLALRIALGQVLTNRVFSVMMLDEIDASCDVDRAKYIAGCLKNLTKTVKQVVLVSHKNGLEADHYITL